MICARPARTTHREKCPSSFATCAVTINLIALLGGCTGSGTGSTTAPGTRMTADGPLTRSTSIRGASTTALEVGNIAVSIPAGAAPHGAALSLTTASIPHLDLPAPVHPVGRLAKVRLGASLSEPATVSFPAPAALSDVTLPVVFWQDGHRGWQVVPTSWKPGQARVTAVVSHFSWRFLGTIDAKAWAKKVSKTMAGFPTGRANVAQPHCQNETTARSGGVTVSTDGGDSIKWCFGEEHGNRILRISNNRRTFTQVTYPATWTRIDGGSLSFSTDTIARALGTFVSTSPGREARILDGGDVLTLAVPSGASGQVQATMSTEALTISVIFTAIEAYGAVAELAGGAVAAAPKRVPGKLKGLLAGASDVHQTKALRSCTTAFNKMTEDPIDASMAKSLLHLVFNCVPDMMTAYLKNESSRRVALLVSMTSAAVAAVLGFASGLINYGRYLWDEIASLGGNSDPEYTISIAQATPTAAPRSASDLVGFIKAGKMVDLSKYQEGSTEPGQPFLPSYGMAEFMTPSKSIYCGIDPSPCPPGIVTLCHTSTYTFPDPPKEDCGEIAFFPDWLTIKRSSGANQGLCLGCLPIDTYSHPLPYGTTIIDQGFGCRSDATFLTCANLRNGQGFIVSRTEFQKYGR